MHSYDPVAFKTAGIKGENACLGAMTRHPDEYKRMITLKLVRVAYSRPAEEW
jgi:hypothetical protein